MRDHNLELAKLAAGLINEVLGDGMKVKAAYTNSGNTIALSFEGFPLYGSNRLLPKKGMVRIEIPRSTFYLKNGGIYFSKMQQAQCHLYQNGGAFAHPHVYTDGHPCWDGGCHTKATAFIAAMVETLLLENVTKASVEIGRCASGVMGTGDTALRNAASHKAVIRAVLKPKAIAADRQKLERYVYNRWTSLTDIYTKTL